MLNFDAVYELSEFIPDNARYFQQSILPGVESDPSITRFSSCYQDLSFSWHFVREMEAMDRMLPPAVQNDSIVRAFTHRRYGSRDKALIMAIAIETTLPPAYRNTIQSLLYAKDGNYEYIANMTGLPVETIILYADLFYDVPGRADDRMFITSIIYPEGRVEEYDPNYQDRVSYSTLLKRAAYNMGVAEVIKLAGFRSGVDDSMSAVDAGSRLEDQIMSNAVFLSRTGFLNSRSCEGIRMAKNLIAAAKHGGVDDGKTETGIGLGPMSNAIMEELMKFHQPYVEARLSKQRAYFEAEQALKNQIIDVT